MVSKPAMDAAIAAAEKRVWQSAKELREAEKFIRPWVGELSIICDSAESVLRATAKALKIPDADKIHASALKTVIGLVPVPGSRPARMTVALDAAASDEYRKQFPHADRLKK